MFIHRLRPLAQSHELLAAGLWWGASLSQLVQRELEPYGVRATKYGEDLVLNPGLRRRSGCCCTSWRATRPSTARSRCLRGESRSRGRSIRNEVCA